MLAARTREGPAFKIRRDLEFHAADAGEEGKAVDLTHEVADLAKLLLGRGFGCGFSRGRTKRHIFFFEGRGRDDVFM